MVCSVMEGTERVAEITLPSRASIATLTSRRSHSYTIGSCENDNWGCPQPKQPAKRRVISIFFYEEDDDGVQFLHDDVVVIIMNMKNYDVHRILINYGSSACVLYFDALLKIGMSPE